MKKEICGNLCESMAEKPRRKRGCLCGCLASILIVVAMIVALAVWIHILGRDIKPADFSDLALPAHHIAPEENAYTYFVKAAEALVTSYTDENGDIVSFMKYRHDNRTNMTVIAEILAANEETLEYLQQGIQCQRCIYPLPTRIDEPFPHAGKQIGLAMLLSSKVRYEQEEGSIDVAVQDVHTLLRYGQLVRQVPYAIIGFLVGLAVEGIGVSEIQRLARDPQLSDNQLRELLELVNDILPYDASLQYASKTEFYHCVMAMEDIEKGAVEVEGVTVKSPRKTFLYLPQQTRLDFANHFRMMIHESPKFYVDMTHNCDDDFDRLKPNFYKQGNKPSAWLTALVCRNMIGKMLQNLMMPAIAGALNRRCIADGNVAVAKVIIACHLFEREKGRRPQTLDELVPEYLPAVPLDPFDGKPFRYKPDDGILYSVGKSLRDLDGKAYAPDTTREQCEPDELRNYPWEADNAVFHIWE